MDDQPSLPKEKTLEVTPTWAVAVVCFVIVVISIVIEQLIHHTESWLKKRRKAPLQESLEKIKAELMLLGFISLLLTILQDPLSNICVPRKVGHSWHPCQYTDSNAGKYYDPCLKKGKIQLVSAYGIHQLHIFIFVLAICHIIYCVATYGLGKLKMKKWKAWEEVTKTVEYQYYNDPERFRLARETSFGRRHLHFWSRSPILLWIVCFFRQFIRSVAKVDYLTLRHGFITEHLPSQSQSSFNFQKYISKSLDEDFKVIVGISPVIWVCAVLFLLTNTNGWYSHFWLPFIPLIIILLVGAKLQVIITKMGIRILEGGDVIKGSLVVQPSDDLFWFGRPRFILFLIHFVLFLNAFQLAFFAWSWYEFGYPSCYHESIEDIIIRISMGVLIQVLCSYVTLPLYALVTRMGSKMKPVIFGDDVASALRGWQETAKKHAKEGQPLGRSTSYSSRPSSLLPGSMSPGSLLHGRRKSNGLGVGGGGEGASPSPSHHNFNRKDRLSETSAIKIGRDVENPSTPEGLQKPTKEVEIT
ncbi:Seven transmembrane MLO family protein [Perilla frutescens var. frutescens]|nr:Seven transmembrane MLO family protein [Perilla frutescens var. frutescens]